MCLVELHSLRKKHHRWVFWLPIIIDLFLVIFEFGMLFGDIPYLREHIRHKCQKKYIDDDGCVDVAACNGDDRCHAYKPNGLSCDWRHCQFQDCGCGFSKPFSKTIIALTWFLAVNCFPLNFFKLIIARFAERHELCFSLPAFTVLTSWLLSLSDTCFMLVATLFNPLRTKKLMILHTSGDMPFWRRPLKAVDLCLRLIPHTVFCVIVLFKYQIAAPWMAAWFGTALLYFFSMANRWHYDFVVKHPSPKPTPAPKPIASATVGTTLTPARTPLPSASTTPNAFDTPPPSARSQEMASYSGGSVYGMSSPHFAARSTPPRDSGASLRLPTMQMMTPTYYSPFTSGRMTHAQVMQLVYGSQTPETGAISAVEMGSPMRTYAVSSTRSITLPPHMQLVHGSTADGIQMRSAEEMQADYNMAIAQAMSQQFAQL